jgi:hypothetical protein
MSSGKWAFRPKHFDRVVKKVHEIGYELAGFTVEGVRYETRRLSQATTTATDVSKGLNDFDEILDGEHQTQVRQ